MGSAIPYRGTAVDASSLTSPHRSGRLFGKYGLSGRTYTTAGGALIPTELQYYGGEMAHFYGECTHVAAVNEALAGSGYHAITLKYADGRQTAAAQVWASRFTDTTIGAYNAMFIVVAAVPEGAPAQRTCLAADPNGAAWHRRRYIPWAPRTAARKARPHCPMSASAPAGPLQAGLCRAASSEATEQPRSQTRAGRSTGRSRACWARGRQLQEFSGA